MQVDSVAIGHYSLNCHGVYSPRPGVTVGHFGANVSPYQIPYRVLFPPNVDGLLVPVAVSASHVGDSTIRSVPAETRLAPVRTRIPRDRSVGVGTSWTSNSPVLND